MLATRKRLAEKNPEHNSTIYTRQTTTTSSRITKKLT